MAIAVDDQARITRQHRRRPQQDRQAPRDLGDADVPGDVSPPLAGVEPEIAQDLWDRRRGMVANRQAGPSAALVMELEGRRIVGTQKRRSRHGCD